MPDASNTARIAALTLKDTVSVKVGKTTLYVYPRVDASMSIAKQAYAFHVTKAAFHTVPLPPDVHLETFGSYLNCSAVVDDLKFDLGASSRVLVRYESPHHHVLS